MKVTSLRSVLAYAAGIAAIGIVAATCSDLTGPTGLAPGQGGIVTITYMGPPVRANGIVQMTVGDSVKPLVDVRIGSAPASRARWVFTTKDTSLKEGADTIVLASKDGESLIAKGRGPAKIIVTLVGSTIGGKADVTARTADTLDVIVKPAKNVVNPSPFTFAAPFVSLGQVDTLRALSLDTKNAKTKSGQVAWFSTNVAIAAVNATGIAGIDSINRTPVTAIGNGIDTVGAIF